MIAARHVLLWLLCQPLGPIGASSAGRYLTGPFPPHPACDAQYNAPCSPSNAYAAVQRAVGHLGNLDSPSAAETWLAALNDGEWSNGVDGWGFGPMVVSPAGVVLADPENPHLIGLNFSDILSLRSSTCGLSYAEANGSDALVDWNCYRVTMTLFQEELLSWWSEAAVEGDGWTSWIWTRSGPPVQNGLPVPEKKVGYVESVSTPLGSLFVASSFSDTRLASGFASDSTCSAKYNELCSVELSRMLVGDGLTKMMMANTPSELTRVFYDFTFSSEFKAGAGFYIFVYRFGPPGSPGEWGECVAHGANSGHIGQNLTEILLKVKNAGVDGRALHQSFLSAAEDGGGWVDYEWRNKATEPPYFKIALIAGTERFGTKYYIGVGFTHEHSSIEPGPHCTSCSMGKSYFCAIRNTYMLIGHVKAFLLTDVEQTDAWNQLTTSLKSDLALVPVSGRAEEADYKFGGVGDKDAFYAFVYDFNGTCVAHGANGALVGRSLWGILAFAGMNKECDSEDLNCGVTAVDGWQLNEDFKSAASGGGGWVKYEWRSSASDPPFEKVAYLVKISKYGRDFYAGVGYNNIMWDPPSARSCSAGFAGKCSEDNVVAIAGHLAAAIQTAQDRGELARIFSLATNGTGREYRRPGGFYLEVYDESGVCHAHGGSQGLVGQGIEDIFLTLGSKLLGVEQYTSMYKKASVGDFFTYNWQMASMKVNEKRNAFAVKATFKPLNSNDEIHFYIVSSFKDENAPPRCEADDDCPPSAVCGDGGYCQCKAGTIAEFEAAGSCGADDGCACETQDYNMTCEVNQCPAGTFGNSDGQCQNCDPGKYAEQSQSSECSACSPGKYQDQYGASSCRSCSAGTSINAGGSTACESCREGWYQAEDGASLCEKCDYGWYSHGTMNVKCNRCPMDRETTADRAAVSQWECVCEQGTHRGAGHSEEDGTHKPCHACPEGMECAEGNEEPVLAPGFWSADEDSILREYSVFRCRNPRQCPGGASGTCTTGREGVACANCMPAHQEDRDTGGCEPCGATSVVPILIIISVCIFCFVGMAMYARVDVCKVKMNTLAVGICIGQTAVAVQALAVFKVLDVDWVEPIRSFLNFVAVFSFDLDMLAISCMFPDSQVVNKYIIKLFIFPCGVLVLCTIFFVQGKVLKHHVELDHVINSIGLLFLVLFLTLAMVALAPFHCVSSPNGTMSLDSNPSVICFEDSNWTMLAVFGAFAVLGYIVAFMAWVTYVTLSYPRMLTSGSGMLVINRYRFLFQRFTVECYYFTPIYLARNFSIAILPVVFADYGHRQVFLLAFVLMLFGFLQGWLRPWRGLLPNVLDTITTFCLIMALVGAALLNNADFDKVVLDMQVFFSIIITVVVAATFGFLSYMAYRHFFPAKLFAAFLCHHKGGCAVGARLMKMELEERLRGKVFLDSDALDNLEDLLDIVRVSIDHLVILLTASTLSRPWCAGEVATAFKNGVSMVPVAYDDYTELTDEDLTEEAVAKRWPAEAFAPCLAQGVSLAGVRSAYEHLRGMEKIALPRVSACIQGNPAMAMHGVACVAARCLGKPPPMLEPAPALPPNPLDAAASRHLSATSTTKDLDLAVLANYTDAEAISTSRVLSRLIRNKTQWTTAEFLHPRDVQRELADRHHVHLLCVVLTEGCLTSEGFPKVLLETTNAFGQTASVVPVRMERFEYPTGELLKSSIVPQVAKLLTIDTEEVAELYRMLLSILSVPFSPHGHISVLEAEVDGVVRRLNADRAMHPERSSRSSRGPPPSGRANYDSQNNGGLVERCGASTEVPPGACAVGVHAGQEMEGDFDNDEVPVLDRQSERSSRSCPDAPKQS